MININDQFSDSEYMLSQMLYKLIDQPLNNQLDQSMFIGIRQDVLQIHRDIRSTVIGKLEHPLYELLKSTTKN